MNAVAPAAAAPAAPNAAAQSANAAVVAEAGTKLAEHKPLTLNEGAKLWKAKREEATNPISDAARTLSQARKAKTAQPSDDSALSQVQGAADEAAGSTAEDESNEDTHDEIDTAEGESPDATETPQEIDLGEGVKVTLDEVRDGFMLKADHTRKTQALAEERAQFENARSQRIELLDTAIAAAMQGMGKRLNLRAHLEADPINGVMNHAIQEERFEQFAMLRQIRGQEQAHDSAQRKQATINALKEKLGDKAESHYSGAVKLASEMVRGLSPEYLDAQMAHPDIADIVYDAKRWRDLQASKGKVVAQVAAKPKVVKPAARMTQQAGAQSAVRNAHNQLKSSGKLADAVAFMRTLRGQKRG